MRGGQLQQDGDASGNLRTEGRMVGMVAVYTSMATLEREAKETIGMTAYRCGENGGNGDPDGSSSGGDDI